MTLPSPLRTAAGSLNATLPGDLLSNGTNGTSCSVDRPMEVPDGIFLTLGALSFVENLLVVAAIVKNRNLHSPMYYFICCLAVSDVLVSIGSVVETVFILLISHRVLVATPSTIQRMDDVLDTLICSSVMSSLSFLSVIAVDRYITIFYALRYHNIMTFQRAVVIMAVVWTVSSISSVIFITYHRSESVIYCLVSFFFLVVTLIVVLYIHMFTLARRHAQRISSMPRKQAAPLFSSMKGAVTLSLLLGVFFICWGPFFLHLILILSCPSHPACNCYFQYYNLYIILIICNSVLDPIIYAFRSQELRRTLKEVVFCFW